MLFKVGDYIVRITGTGNPFIFTPERIFRVSGVDDTNLQISLFENEELGYSFDTKWGAQYFKLADEGAIKSSYLSHLSLDQLIELENKIETEWERRSYG